MKSYNFKYRRKGLWPFYKTVQVVGHAYNEKMDRLFLDLTDGTVLELAEWSKCDAKLGLDWMNAVKTRMESQAGQAIPINR